MKKYSCSTSVIWATLLSVLMLSMVELTVKTASAEVVASPGPCSQGFWKNRADGKSGISKNNFPGTSFTVVVTSAVALSKGDFTSNADLLAPQSKPMTTAKALRAQYAAFLLNLAAGNTDGLTQNTSCRVCQNDTFTPTPACGEANTLGQVLTNIQNHTLTGENAVACLDLINSNDPSLALALADTCQPVQATCPCGQPQLPGTPNDDSLTSDLGNVCSVTSLTSNGAVSIKKNDDNTFSCLSSGDGSWSSPNTPPQTSAEANACITALRSLGGPCADSSSYQTF